MSSFRTECEEHCRRELEARLVLLVMEGDHMEIQKSVTTTRLYHNLTEYVPFMGLYDVKMRGCVTSSRVKDSCIVSPSWMWETSNASSPRWSLSCGQGAI